MKGHPDYVHGKLQIHRRNDPYGVRVRTNADGSFHGAFFNRDYKPVGWVKTSEWVDDVWVPLSGNPLTDHPSSFTALSDNCGYFYNDDTWSAEGYDRRADLVERMRVE